MVEPQRQGGAAVLVKDAYKKYGNHVVLRGLNMTVPEGTIYGFLGPSGCGKTTLLSAIVGRNRLDAGDIYVKVQNRNMIGYMPQELALFLEFSIKETLNYYGCLYGMSEESIRRRMAELLQFLELPHEDSVIKKTSGGQQRRVSLCSALLHDPTLLILDEPTVGVDPVLSHSIWQRLMQMSTVGKKTIIITTHYIEEARQAHTIGLMRGGVILAEGEPNHLISLNNCDTLEQVFLKLSQKQSYDIDNEVVENYPKPKRKPNSPIKDSPGISSAHVRSHFVKSIYWMKRNIPIMCFLMLLPIVQCTLFNLTFGLDPQGLQIGVVNEELKGTDRECSTFTNTSCDLSVLMSCQYLNKLTKKTMIIKYYDSIEAGRRGVQDNTVWGLMHFSSNYSTSLLERLQSNLNTEDLSVDLSEVQVWMDMSNQYIGNLIRRDLYFGYIEFLKTLYESCQWPVKAAAIPIHYNDAVYGDNNPVFVHFAVPAVIQLFEFYLPMMFTVGAILMEKRAGLLERSLVCGMTLPETMIGHAVVQFVVLAIQTLFMMVVLFVFFDNPLHGNLALALILLFLVGISGMCYGYMVASLCDSDTAATYMGLGSFFPLAMLSGMVWPYEGMHYLLRSVGWFLPLTLTTEAFRSISARSWGLTHPAVYAGFFSAFGWIFFFSFATWAIVKLKKGIKSS